MSTFKISIQDLRASLDRSLEKSLGGLGGGASAQNDEFTLVQQAYRGCMSISDDVLRVPLYRRRCSESDPPIVVVEFDVSGRYPNEIPKIRVVTHAEFLSKEEVGNLVSYLGVQAEAKLGSRMLSHLLALATMWVEIQWDLWRKREAVIEQEKARERARRQRELEEEERLKELVRLEEEKKAKGLDVPPEEAAAEEEVEDESTDSAEKERRHRDVSKFSVKFGQVPSLKNLCIKAFGDHLLLFEGFEEVPIIIRAKVFSYLVDTKSLSHRKLALLVGSDQKKLDLSKCSKYVHDHYMEVLQKTTALQFLCLAGCSGITDEGTKFFETCGKITDLNMAGTNITTVGLSTIVKNCPNLAMVDFSGCNKIKSGFEALAKRCDKLMSLKVNNCKELDPNDALSVIQYAGRFFHTYEMARIGENALKTYTSTQPAHYSYSYFHSYRTSSVKAFTLDYTPLKRAPPSLTVLNMAECFFLTDHFVTNFFMVDLPGLQRFDHKGSALSSVGVMHILSRCTGLTKFVADTWADEKMVYGQQNTVSQMQAQEIESFSKFMISCANMKMLREVEIGNNPLIKAEMLKPLVQLKSLTRLSLSKLTHKSCRLMRLIPFITLLKTLKVLKLSKLRVEVKREQPKEEFFSLVNLELLQLWDLKLKDSHVESVLAKAFGRVTSLSLRGVTHMSSQGLKTLVNVFDRLTTLTLDKDTGISYPLSALLDEQHKAPIREVHLPNYLVDQLFSVDTLNNILDEKRTTNSKIKVIDLERTATAVYALQQSIGVVFQALFFLLPFLEDLDLTHQLVQAVNRYGGAVGRVVELPNNQLQKLRYCCRCDTARVVNPNPRCDNRMFDCKPELGAVAGKFGIKTLEYSDDSWDGDLGGLFD